MKKTLIVLSILIALFVGWIATYFFFTFQKPKEIATDPIQIKKGEELYQKNCVVCHIFKQDVIGPKLGGITEEVSVSWLKEFIKDPNKMKTSGDPRATTLFKKYKTQMPAFSTLTDNDLDAIISYFATQKKPKVQSSKNVGKEIANPYPAPIQFSGLEVGLEAVAQFPASSKIPPLARIQKLGFSPNYDGMYVVDLRGKLYKLKDKTISEFMDMAKLKPKFVPEPGLASGFGSFAFHPDFAKNGLFYTTHTESKGSGTPDFKYSDSIKVILQWVVTEWKVKNPKDVKFSGTSRELLRFDATQPFHGIQEIAFNPVAKQGTNDYGILYICIGDLGSVEGWHPEMTGSNVRPWGTIFRINPTGNNSANGKYGIPKDNPFVKSTNSKALKEIYAYGFRNPHRISWTKNGQIIIANIGQANCESLYLLKSGHNYGWPTREGSFVFYPKEDLNKVYPLPANDTTFRITYPIAEFDHDEGIAMSGGLEYSATTIPELNGKYFFGDIPSGRLFYININEIKQGKLTTIHEWKVTINGVQKSLKDICGSVRVDLHFGKDKQGNLYILTKADGKVYKLVSAKQ